MRNTLAKVSCARRASSRSVACAPSLLQRAGPWAPCYSWCLAPGSLAAKTLGRTFMQPAKLADRFDASAYPPNYWESSLMGVACAVATLAAACISYVPLGVLSGVFGICQTAPRWWVDLYFGSFCIIPTVAVLVGFLCQRLYLRSHERRAA